MDLGVRDPHCDHCKRALGPLYHHKIVGNRHLPVFTFDFSGPHPRKVNMAQYLLVAVWSLGHMRLLWAFGVESRQTSVVLPCLQSCFEDLRALTGGSRPPILRLHSLERPCASQEGGSMLLRREGGFLRRGGGFLRRGEVLKKRRLVRGTAGGPLLQKGGVAS